MLKGLMNYADLQKVCENMGKDDRFLHKKNGYLIKEFFVNCYKEDGKAECKEVQYWYNNRHFIKVKVQNLYKHFEVVNKMDL